MASSGSSSTTAVTRARLELSRAARATLRSGLDLVGVTAPERMDRIPEEE